MIGLKEKLRQKIEEWRPRTKRLVQEFGDVVIDQVNPGSVILTGAMMFKYLGWHEVHDLIWQGLEKAISQKKVTYDFHRQMEGAKLLKCSEFVAAIIENMQ